MCLSIERGERPATKTLAAMWPVMPLRDLSRRSPCDFVHGMKRKYVNDLVMGLLRGAVFHHDGVPENSPSALMGRSPPP